MSYPTLFDLNRFPKETGMIIFPISMSRIQNAQSPEKCFEYIECFWNKVSRTEGIGLTFVYTDYLYMNDNQPAHILKDRYISRMSAHKYGFQRILEKNPRYIKTAFSYLTWADLIINCSPFTSFSGRLKKLSDSDSLLQRCIAHDAGVADLKNLSEHKIDFFLEESLLMQMITMKQVVFPNEYVHHRERWVLLCYPGKPLLTETYLYQKNPFKLSAPENTFCSSYYDLEEKKLYDLLSPNMEELLEAGSLEILKTLV